jgi:hypothetical protein
MQAERQTDLYRMRLRGPTGAQGRRREQGDAGEREHGDEHESLHGEAPLVEVLSDRRANRTARSRQALGREYG